MIQGVGNKWVIYSLYKLKRMRSIIGLVLFIVWGLLLVLGLAEPTSTTEIPNNPEWVGWVYIMLLLGLPFIALNIAHDDVKRG